MPKKNIFSSMPETAINKHEMHENEMRMDARECTNDITRHEIVQDEWDVDKVKETPTKYTDGMIAAGEQLLSQITYSSSPKVWLSQQIMLKCVCGSAWLPYTAFSYRV